MYEVILLRNTNRAYAKGFRVNGVKDANLSVQLTLLNGATQLWQGALAPVLNVEGDYSAEIPPAALDGLASELELTYVLEADTGGVEFYRSGKVVTRAA